MILHISHNDLDGVGCGILVKAAYPSVKTIYRGYDELGNMLDSIHSGYDMVIVTDLSPSEAILESIAGECELLLIDHHISSETLNKYPFVIHENGKSATLLTYEKLTSIGFDLSAYEDFVCCVNDFDLWKLKRDDSLRMNLLFILTGISRFEKRFLTEPYCGFKAEEEMLIALEEERRNNYIERALKYAEYFTDKDQRKLAVLFSEMYTSELGNSIISRGLADYVILINVQRKSVSLRSAKDTDISEIAARHGGGGHKNAAGFPFISGFNVMEFLIQLELM
ncbi:MAG: phosphoesterase [Deferribacteraceae bacterium]|jgi:oligoribonuclease NrnB/cAMP/cGMP phosphodiesterase (DHH superfamily)|nr:phosphoesterase [Deferribacteraceae bacterium]